MLGNGELTENKNHLIFDRQFITSSTDGLPVP